MTKELTVPSAKELLSSEIRRQFEGIDFSYADLPVTSQCLADSQPAVDREMVEQAIKEIKRMKYAYLYGYGRVK